MASPTAAYCAHVYSVRIRIELLLYLLLIVFMGFQVVLGASHSSKQTHSSAGMLDLCHGSSFAVPQIDICCVPQLMPPLWTFCIRLQVCTAKVPAPSKCCI